MDLIRISPAILQETAAGKDLTTSLPYRHSSWIVRELFWSRLQRLLNLYPGPHERVLDLGGGSGILLPTLSQAFRQVVCLDRFLGEAQGIVDRYRLANVTLITGNLLRSGLPDNAFDVVIAADVLEHVLPLREALQEIVRLTRSRLLISGPTENLAYRLGRPIFGFKKPKDHYYTYRQVEEHIIDAGFLLEKRSYTPGNLGESFSAFGLACFRK